MDSVQYFDATVSYRYRYDSRSSKGNIHIHSEREQRWSIPVITNLKSVGSVLNADVVNELENEAMQSHGMRTMEKCY